MATQHDTTRSYGLLALRLRELKTAQHNYERADFLGECQEHGLLDRRVFTHNETAEMLALLKESEVPDAD